MEFARQRKSYQAEYQLLTQPFDRDGNTITLHLHNPIQETLLSTLRNDLTAFLRQQLKNTFITITGDLKEEDDTRKTLYTNREKFEFLIQKNPALKELKERMGLDTDF